MVRWVKNKVFVDFHEWAWSARTSGYGVYAITQQGDIIKIGVTTKKPASYEVTDDTIAIFRYYESNRGYVTLHLYMRDGRQYTIEQKENFRMPYDIDDKIKVALIKWLNMESD